jgi:ubiquinone/menaquinone biosynthesis C-methylase UbiE
MIARMQDRYRFLIEQGRLEPVCMNVFSYFKSCYDECFDGITSSWTIHNFTIEQRLELFQDILRTMRPGSLFVNMDKYVSDNPAEEESSLEDFKHRLKHINKLGRPEVADELLKHELADRAPEYIMKQKESVGIMKKLGFKHVRFVMRLGREAVLVAEK